MKRTFASVSFGCRVNEAEKIALDRKLSEFGFLHSADNPNVYIVNTCAVTGKAEHEARQCIHRIRREFPHTTLLVTGCSATYWKGLHQQIQGVDFLIPNSDKQQIPYLMRELSQTSSIPKNIRLGRTIKQELHKTADDKFIDSGRLILKVQDGCERFCAYCIVPYLRGKPTSLSSEKVISIIRSYGPGIKEVVITGINTEYIGNDHNESLPILLNAILNRTSVARLSLGSLHPWSITDEFIEWYAGRVEDSRFVHFFHIPIQSGSNRVLHLMNRGYTKEDISKRIGKLASIDHTALIGTDIIVGFPGETKKDFEDTVKFLQTHPIVKYHIFRYSSRTDTKASFMEKQYKPLPVDEIKKRSRQLIHLGQQKYRTYLASLCGKSYIGLSLCPNNKKIPRALMNNQVIINLNQYVRPRKFIRIDGLRIRNNEIFGNGKQIS